MASVFGRGELGIKMHEADWEYNANGWGLRLDSHRRENILHVSLSQVYFHGNFAKISCHTVVRFKWWNSG